tara:strand:+ start:111 stop:653 length:543 start_codon:yes stop_codon:yes gene_type:complete
MAVQQAKRLAGPALDEAIGRLLGTAGDVATDATASAMRGITKGVFGKNRNQIPTILRDQIKGQAGPIPQLVGAGTQTYLGIKGIQGGMNMIGQAMGTNKQQSEFTQPMDTMQKFVLDSELENRRFRNELALIAAKAEARDPYDSYLTSAQAEKTLSEAGEITNAEVLQVARSIYGTGFRA